MAIVKYISILLSLIFIVAILFIANAESSEKLVLGDWKEISWHYEKLNSNELSKHQSGDGLKDEIYNSLIIHKAEKWQFNPDGTLQLHGNKDEVLNWTIKGRGHILELTHVDGRVEDYQIEMLDDRLMVVYFSFDLQIRGIVKMTFLKA